MVYPKDCSERKKGTKARTIVPQKFDADHWDWHEQTGTDHGTDMIFEYIENDEFRGAKIEGQIKGTSKPRMVNDGAEVSFDLDVKTINYGLGCRNSYVLFLVDLEKEDVYYMPIQEYFIADTERYGRLEKNQSTFAIRIPIENKVTVDDDRDLREIAKSGYTHDSDGHVKRSE